jgi:two-component system heavy metal sensor histidine kinase CusS
MSLKTAPEPQTAIRPSTPIAPPRAWSLAARLTAWYALSAFILILLATIILYWALSRSLDDGHDLFLVDKIHIVSNLLRNNPHGRALLREVEEGSTARQYAKVFVRITDRTGKLIAQSPEMDQILPGKLFPPPVNGDAADANTLGATVVDLNGQTFRAMSANVTSHPGGANEWTVQAALSKMPERRVLAGFRRWLWIVLSIALLLCVIVGYEIARQGIRHIKVISAAARRIRSTTLHERIEQANLPAELSDLAEGFNDMLNRLEEAFARLSRFSADIAHELRTPVNNLRGQSEVALSRPRSPDEYRETLGSCLEESVRLSRIIDSMLFLARAENPRGQLRTESVNVIHELGAVREFYEAAASEAGVKLEISGSSDIHLNVDRTLFHRAVGNLIGNALAHTPAGGTVQLDASAAPENMTRVDVIDTGCGIAPEHLPHVLDRFYRADQARSAGTGGGNVGLGLAIVRSIASMHGGRVEIQSRQGHGTRVSLYFPVRQEQVKGAATIARK